jgi:hypothetical protein
MSDSVLIVTREQPTAPAIKYTPGYFYESYRSELELSRSQSYRVAFPNGLMSRREELNASKARQLITELGFAVAFSREDYQRAAEYARSPTSSFA